MTRLYHSIAAGVLVGLTAIGLRLWVPERYLGNDLWWPFCYARQLLEGSDPYGAACQLLRPWGEPHTANPLTAALIAIPFVRAGLDLRTGAALILGLCYGLLAGALFWRGGSQRLLLLLSLPSVAALWRGQWSPLLLAVALLPACLPLTLVKPHVGLPIAITHVTRWRALGCALFLGITLVVDPTWPFRWLPLTRTHDGFIPFLTLPGIGLLLGLWHWRDRDMRYVLMCALVPQKAWYDALVLAAVLRTPQELRVWTICSWLAGLGMILSAWLPMSALDAQVGGLYLPVCLMLCARRRD